MADSTAGGGEILTDSGIGYSSDYAIFARPLANVGTAEVKYTKYRPTGSFSPESPVEFRISSAGALYTDFKRSRLHVKAKVVLSDGSPLPPVKSKETVPPEARVSVCNLFFQSLWQQCDVTFNGKLMSNSSPTYPFLSYATTLFNFSKDAKDTQLQTQLWVKDTSPYLKDPDYIDGGNEGLSARGRTFAESHLVEMEGPLLVPCLQLQKYLINGIETKIKLYPTSPQFKLISSNPHADYKVILEDIYFLVAHIVPSPQILLAHQEALKIPKALAHYQYMNTDIRQFSLAKGTFSTELDDLFLGMVPSELTLMFVSASSFNGAWGENPFALSHYNVTHIQGTVNHQPFPIGQLTPDFEKGHYVNEYLSLFRARNKDYENFGFDVSLYEYAHGFCAFSMNIQPQTYEADDFWPLVQKGNVRLQIRFGKELPEAVTLLVLAKFPSYFSVDQSRNIIKE